MLKYLNYILSVINELGKKDVVNALSDEVNCYKEYWEKYQSDNSKNPLYNSMPTLYDNHKFSFHTGEQVSISWDIVGLYKIALSSCAIQHITLNDFERVTAIDRENTIPEMKRIWNEVNSIYIHQYDTVLIINFKPTQTHIILDGRHRYTEYKKLRPNDLIPVYILDDEQCFTNIIMKRDFLAYIILHNIEVLNNFVLGKELSLNRMLNIAKCLGE